MDKNIKLVNLHQIKKLYRHSLSKEMLTTESQENSMNKYNKIVIGLDQSYKNTGISIAADDKLKKVSSIHLEKCDCNSDRRQKIRLKLESCLNSVIMQSGEVECIIERIRLRSNGFLNIDYIKSIGALNATIVDVCTCVQCRYEGMEGPDNRYK